jgi:hypothetical protein
VSSHLLLISWLAGACAHSVFLMCLLPLPNATQAAVGASKVRGQVAAVQNWCALVVRRSCSLLGLLLTSSDCCGCRGSNGIDGGAQSNRGPRYDHSSQLSRLSRMGTFRVGHLSTRSICLALQLRRRSDRAAPSGQRAASSSARGAAAASLALRQSRSASLPVALLFCFCGSIVLLIAFLSLVPCSNSKSSSSKELHPRASSAQLGAIRSSRCLARASLAFLGSRTCAWVSVGQALLLCCFPAAVGPFSTRATDIPLEPVLIAVCLSLLQR